MPDTLDRLNAALQDRYRIEHTLGAGGMATVYLAEDTRHHRKVAVKVLRPELAAILGAERFLKEIEVTANLQHPNILPLFDSGRVAPGADGRVDLLYYVMPYVEGESLRERLRREEPIPVAEAVGIASDVANALDYAHRRNVVHRDIKPENILLSDGRPMIADFGLALAVNAAGDQRLTETGFAVGTPDYMSPEQVSGEIEVDGRCDLYALACVLYEMLVGSPPFVAPTARAVMARHMVDAPPSVAAARAVPDALAAAVARAMAKEPADRFDTLAEFARRISHASGSHENTTATAEEPGPPATGSTGPTRIAVLPFANRSPDAESEYFCDGITEEIINALVGVPGLQVIARTSAFAFRGQERDIREIGEQLGVSTILEGSVRKAGQRLRITTQLTDVTGGHHLWSDRYDRELDDVFEIQDEIADAVVRKLTTQFTASLPPRKSSHSENPDAYDAYLRGRWAWNKGTGESWIRSIEYFDRAIELDPTYALAWAGRSMSYFWLGFFEYMSPREAYPPAQAAASRAIECDDLLAEAHAARASIRMVYEWDWAAADQGFKRALALNPQSTAALQAYSVFHGNVGNPEAVFDLNEKELEVDPLWVKGHQDLGYWLYVMGRYDEALEQLSKTVELDPNYFTTHLCLGMVYVEQHDFPKAIDAMEAGVETSGGALLARAFLGSALGLGGRVDEARAVLRELEVQAKTAYVSPVLLAWVQIGLGNFDAAFARLEEAIEERSSMLISLPNGRYWNPIRQDPRFTQVLLRMGLPYDPGSEVEADPDGGPPSAAERD